MELYWTHDDVVSYSELMVKQKNVTGLVYNMFARTERQLHSSLHRFHNDARVQSDHFHNMPLIINLILVLFVHTKYFNLTYLNNKRLD